MNRRLALRRGRRSLFTARGPQDVLTQLLRLPVRHVLEFRGGFLRISDMELELSKAEDTRQNRPVDVNALDPVDAGVTYVLHEDALPHLNAVLRDPVPHGPPHEPRIHDHANRHGKRRPQDQQVFRGKIKRP